jgi:hypothetical protein
MTRVLSCRLGLVFGLTTYGPIRTSKPNCSHEHEDFSDENRNGTSSETMTVAKSLELRLVDRNAEEFTGPHLGNCGFGSRTIYPGANKLLSRMVTTFGYRQRACGKGRNIHVRHVIVGAGLGFLHIIVSVPRRKLLFRLERVSVIFSSYLCRLARHIRA